MYLDNYRSDLGKIWVYRRGIDGEYQEIGGAILATLGEWMDAHVWLSKSVPKKYEDHQLVWQAPAPMLQGETTTFEAEGYVVDVETKVSEYRNVWADDHNREGYTYHYCEDGFNLSYT